MAERDAGERAQSLDLPGAVRALRRRADLSQRELAARAGTDPARVGELESGHNGNPRLRTVERLVGATGARLAVLDVDGTEPVRPATDSERDGAGRRFPPHLDPVPRTRWHGIYRWDWTGFVRSRGHRDLLRRADAGERRWHMFTEIRRLGPGDTAVLRALHADAGALDPAGRPAPDGAELDEASALRYLREPSLRHWVAEDRGCILGHLVAYLHRRYAGPPALVVTEIGTRSDERARPVGGLLVAAACDEADRQDASVRALADHPAVAAYLRRLGFHPAPKGGRLLAA